MNIYALSSGPGISGIAVIRISGKDTSEIIKTITQKPVPRARVATLRKINKINTSVLIDEAIILWFPGHLHMFPSKCSLISSSDGLEFVFSKSVAAITIPGVQNPQ